MRKSDVSNTPNFYDQILEEEKSFNISDPCDPNHPDYPWIPCGIDTNKTNN